MVGTKVNHLYSSDMILSDGIRDLLTTIPPLFHKFRVENLVRIIDSLIKSEYYDGRHIGTFFIVD